MSSFVDSETTVKRKVHPNFHGKKGCSGPRVKPKNVLRYFNERFDLQSKEMVDITLEKALGGDTQMIMYCWDRRLGRVKTAIEAEGSEALAAGMIGQILEIASGYRRKRLAEAEGGQEPGDALIPTRAIIEATVVDTDTDVVGDAAPGAVVDKPGGGALADAVAVGDDATLPEQGDNLLADAVGREEAAQCEE